MPRMTAVLLPLLALALSAAAQFPDSDVQGQPGNNPIAPVGNLQFSGVDQNAQPFEGQVQAAPKVFTKMEMTDSGASYSVSYGSGSPVFGFVYEFGSFNIYGNTGEGLFTLRSQGQFPNNQVRNSLYRASLTYYGKYQDPNSGITGYLYYADLAPPVGERRWFLFGDQTVAQDGLSDGFRHIVYYNKDGVPRFYARARFFRP